MNLIGEMVSLKEGRARYNHRNWQWTFGLSKFIWEKKTTKDIFVWRGMVFWEEVWIVRRFKCLGSCIFKGWYSKFYRGGQKILQLANCKIFIGCKLKFFGALMLLWNLNISVSFFMKDYLWSFVHKRQRNYIIEYLQWGKHNKII